MKKILIAGLAWGLLIPGLMQAEDIQNQAPQLIPFNQTLFNDFCRYKATEFDYLNDQLFYMTAIGATFTVLGIGAICLGKENLVLYWDKWLTSQGTGSSVWSGGVVLGALHTLCNAILMVPTQAKATYVNAKMRYNGDYEAKRDYWNYLICAPYDQQVNRWHEIVYERFGKPMVHGAVQDGFSYKLKFSKQQGIGVIFLDPQDIENISVLLGIHADKKDSCVCNDIYIVPA